MAKLQQYQQFICSEVANFATVLDPRFPNDVQRDGDILRTKICVTTNDVTPTSNMTAKRKSLFASLIEAEEPSINSPLDEIGRYLHATMSADINTDPLLWWKNHEANFPNIARSARDYLAAQSTSVASESALSVSGNLITPMRSALSDDSISAGMLVRAWLKMLS